MSNPLAWIVEDNEDLAIIFAAALRANQFEVDVFHTGESALEALTVSTPNLVVLDLNLPGIPGARVLDKIRADMQLAKTVIVLATANHQMAKMLENKADLVLVKPITFSQMRELTARFRKV